MSPARVSGSSAEVIPAMVGATCSLKIVWILSLASWLETADRNRIGRPIALRSPSHKFRKCLTSPSPALSRGIVFGSPHSEQAAPAMQTQVDASSYTTPGSTTEEGSHVTQ